MISKMYGKTRENEVTVNYRLMPVNDKNEAQPREG